MDADEAALFAEAGECGPENPIRNWLGLSGTGRSVAGDDAALAAGRPYAMAFVDIRMPPGWDGVETTQKIWAKLIPEVPPVLYTAYADYSWEEMFERLAIPTGCCHPQKPFDTVEALQLAHALTEKWRLHRQSRQKMEELEGRVAERTRRVAVEDGVSGGTGSNSSPDGILVVDRPAETHSAKSAGSFDLLRRSQADCRRR